MNSREEQGLVCVLDDLQDGGREPLGGQTPSGWKEQGTEYMLVPAHLTLMDRGLSVLVPSSGIWGEARLSHSH